ncbi:MAG TPA: hypothetical protein VHC19_09440 [Pirellulales bacterium]|nr:hypothetical protein [Pirellulales bacterium]
MAEQNYIDDSSIADVAVLWRRIPPWHFVLDENIGRFRPSSAAFENHPNGSPMSVVLADEVAASGRSPQDVLAGHARFALAAFTAGLARQCQQGVMREPLLEEPAHAVVFGEKRKRIRQLLAKSATWEVPPGDEPGNA